MRCDMSRKVSGTSTGWAPDQIRHKQVTMSIDSFCPTCEQSLSSVIPYPLAVSLLPLHGVRTAALARLCRYNVCIFAYGQTGSGKTFTMEGPDSSPGVNTRALTEMFSAASARSDDVTYK